MQHCRLVVVVVPSRINKWKQFKMIFIQSRYYIVNTTTRNYKPHLGKLLSYQSCSNYIQNITY